MLQPIVVRKRPLAQIEAARKENAAKDAESHNMFDGRMDSMYESLWVNVVGAHRRSQV